MAEGPASGGTQSDEARTLAEKLLQFKQTLSPHERALFAALMLHVRREAADSDVQGFDEVGSSPIAELITTLFPTPFPNDPEIGAVLGRN